MFWPAELEKDWQLLLGDLADASRGFFLIAYDRPYTCEALLRRLQNEFDRRGWSLIRPSLATDRLTAQLEQALQEWPAKAALVRLDDAVPQQFQWLNLARERLYELPVIILFLASQETYALLLSSAHDLVTWIAPPYSFALPEIGVPHLPTPADQVSPTLAAQIEYYREGVQKAVETGERIKAFDLLAALADLYLSATMYDAAYRVYQALARHYEAGADERRAILFTRRGDIAQGWRVLADLETGRLASDDRVLLRRLLNEGLLSVQESSRGEVIVDEMGRSRLLSPELLLTLKALAESVALGAWDAIKLTQILTSHFDKEELRTLCFNLNVDYDGLPAEGSAGKARELVRYLERRDRVSELIKIGQQLRPTASWQEALKSTEGAFATSDPGVKTGEPPSTAADVQREAFQRALAMAKRTLAILEQQAAGYTVLTVPAHLVVELEEKRRQVAELEARLKGAE